MKVEVKNNIDFKPIKLEITIESTDDLLELYHRFNIFHIVFQDKNIYDSEYKTNFPDNTTEILKILSEELKRIPYQCKK